MALFQKIRQTGLKSDRTIWKEAFSPPVRLKKQFQDNYNLSLNGELVNIRNFLTHLWPWALVHESIAVLTLHRWAITLWA
ncbi:MAG: hypothetical protein KJ874_06570, partial [Acidobacteria bacterium]|nr:hypothetical protein [Acidobacteriota bacterium]